jgi:hypothetical protein
MLTFRINASKVLESVPCRTNPTAFGRVYSPVVAVGIVRTGAGLTSS